mmetsp:Transcript_78689/g.228386  ORF Transcript_78689/g.228386 Transcript_78689/m.228386 type:complete len:296 (-) Transcript_78689:21-908(-)
MARRHISASQISSPNTALQRPSPLSQAERAALISSDGRTAVPLFSSTHFSSILIISGDTFWSASWLFFAVTFGSNSAFTKRAASARVRPHALRNRSRTSLTAAMSGKRSFVVISSTAKDTSRKPSVISRNAAWHSAKTSLCGRPPEARASAPSPEASASPSPAGSSAGASALAPPSWSGAFAAGAASVSSNASNFFADARSFSAPPKASLRFLESAGTCWKSCAHSGARRCNSTTKSLALSNDGVVSDFAGWAPSPLKAAAHAAPRVPAGKGGSSKDATSAVIRPARPGARTRNG